MGAISPAETCLGRGHVFSLSSDVFDGKLEGVQEQMLVLGEQCQAGASRGGGSAGENGRPLPPPLASAQASSCSPCRLFSMFLDLPVLAP